VAEWLCSGLQSRGRRFDSDPSLHNFLPDFEAIAVLVTSEEVREEIEPGFDSIVQGCTGVA